MPIRIEVTDRVGEIVLDHPPVNALDSAGWNALPDMITRLGQDEAVRCVLIRAEGRGFCGGVDIKEMQAHPERIVTLNRGNYLTFRAVRACAVPVVTPSSPADASRLTRPIGWAPSKRSCRASGWSRRRAPSPA